MVYLIIIMIKYLDSYGLASKNKRTFASQADLTGTRFQVDTPLRYN
jgi:hypothetical protein